MERKENLSLLAMLGVLLGAYTYDVHTEGRGGGQEIPQFCGFLVYIYFGQKGRAERGVSKKLCFLTFLVYRP